mgnify:CR=1 FL=1
MALDTPVRGYGAQIAEKASQCGLRHSPLHTVPDLMFIVSLISEDDGRR